MQPVKETIETTVHAVASKVTGTGSVVTLFSWLNSSEFGMWAGIVIGIAGLVVNWYFKRKSDRRNQEAHDVFLAKLREPAPVLSIPQEESNG